MSMNYRTLGGTGMQVSVYCLGTMMFGAFGNPDHDDCERIIHAALDQPVQPRRRLEPAGAGRRRAAPPPPRRSCRRVR
jgi:hypothetical protein